MGLGHPEKADRMATGSNLLGELGNASRRKDYGGGPRGEGETCLAPLGSHLKIRQSPVSQCNQVVASVHTKRGFLKHN